ncbi:MAG TPA: hypothetical protein VFD39_01680 [Trueperaceae bacterium]|nr:hypothetical protein [Trueperaceae bacterium]
MFDETRQFSVTGMWDRQQELLNEAQRLHVANRAVRDAKASLASRRRAVNTSVDTAVEAPTSPGARHRVAPGRTRRVRPAWRAAAGRVGSSLVIVGKRLEGLAVRDND